MYVFDPRKRGVVAAEVFRDAAERYGWIIVSSNNTESDADPQPGIHAIQVMLPDAQRRFAADAQRIYLAGFSGTAIIAWAVAEVSKSVTGVIGCSGRPLPEPRYDVPFAWYGTTGIYDFNWIETHQLERGLAAANRTRRMETFIGAHRWAPKDVAQRGIEWFELLAMKNGTRKRDDALIRELFDKEMAIATANHDVLDAVREYEQIARTFDGLVPVDIPRERAASMRKQREFAAAERDEKRAEDFELAQRVRAARAIAQFLSSEEPPLTGSLARDLNIASLKQLASRNTYEGHAAQRALEAIHGQLSFYQAKNATGQKLMAMQAVAQQIRNP